MTLAERLQMVKQMHSAGKLSELQRRINGQMMPMQPGTRPQVPPHWIGVRG